MPSCLALRESEQAISAQKLALIQFLPKFFCGGGQKYFSIRILNISYLSM